MKSATITYSQYVSVALVNLDARCMLCITLPSLASLPVPYIYIFSQSIANGTIFGERGGGLLRRKYVFRFSLEILSQKFLIIEVLREIIS